MIPKCYLVRILIQYYYVITEVEVPETFDEEIGSETHFQPRFTSSEIDADRCYPTDVDNPSPLLGRSVDLFNAVKLRGSISDRTAILILELMQLPSFNPFEIKHSDIKCQEEISIDSKILKKKRCGQCGENLAAEQNDCSQLW